MRRAHYIAVVVLINFLASFGYGQWKQLTSFDTQIVSIHFLNAQGRPLTGFVGTAKGEVWRTADGGSSWTQTSTPNILSGKVTSFTFKDSLIGWFCALEKSTIPCVYKTTDGGFNWIADTLRGNATSITYNPGFRTLILTTWSGYNMISYNEGARWNKIVSILDTTVAEPMCGVTFCTPQLGVMTGTESKRVVTTTNGGQTWLRGQVLPEMWHPHGIKNTPLVFSVSELSGLVWLSTNSGGDWDYIYRFEDIDLTGYIGGTLKALFVQAKDGIHVSLDSGQTWKPYCGPGNDYDTRMFVVGDTVYAGSVDGKLFANFYGVSHYRDFLEFSRSQFDFLSNGCYRLDSVIHLTNISTCEKVRLIDVHLEGSPTFGFFAQQIPKTLGSTDSLRIFYTPDDLKTDSADLFVSYSIGDSTYTEKIKLKGNGKQGLNIGFGKELEMLLASDCAKLDTFILIKNGPCDSVSLISAVISDPVTFTLSTPPLPYTVGPNGSLNLSIEVNTVTPGDYTATVLIRLSNGKTTLDTTITLKLKVLTSKDPLLTFSKSVLKFDSVSTCDIRFDTLRITNTICKQMTIENVTIAPITPALVVISKPLSGRSLLPNESDSIIIAYAPSDETPLVGSITVRTAFDPTTMRDTQVAISGFGKAVGDASLAPASLTFPSIKECDEVYVESWLVNLSCDSASVIGIDQPSDAGFQVIEPAIPTDLAPGDTIPVRIRVGPISGGSKFDSVGIRIRTRSGAVRLLKLTLLGTVKTKVRSLGLPNMLALDSLLPCVPVDTVIRLTNKGTCDTLVLDSITLAGAPWFVVDPGQLPIRLVPNESIDVRLQFTPPVNGQSTGVLRFYGPGLDTSVGLRIGTGAYVDPMPMALTDSFFTAFLCRNARQYILLSNPFCDTLVIDNISLTGSNGQFYFTPPLTLPLRILPDTDTTLEIEFDPNVPGDSTALLTIGSGDHNITKRVPLLGSYRNTKGAAGIEAITEDGTKRLLIGEGEFFTINIRSNTFIERARNLDTIECTLRFNDNVLTYVNSSYLWGGLAGFRKDSGLLRFGIQNTASDDIQPGQVLGTVTFFTTIGDSTFSPLDLSVRLNPGDLLYEQCVLEPLALDPIRVDIDDTCGDAIIRKWINRRLDIFDNFTIVPNPTDGHEEILVKFDLLHQQDVTVSLYDANGKKLKDETYPLLRKGKHEIRLATPTLSEGWCFIMVESPGQRDVKKLVFRK